MSNVLFGLYAVFGLGFLFLISCILALTESKQNTELRELLGLEPVSLVIKRGRFRWFGHVEHKDDGDWVKQCMLMETEGTRWRKT